MREDRDYHNSGCVNLSTLLLLLLALPAAVRAWRADVRCADLADCRGRCRRADAHEGEHWHCTVNDAPVPPDLVDHVPVRSTSVDSVSRETTAVFSAGPPPGHPALSRIPLPVDPDGHGS
jgi:hypothetical protein